MIRFEVFAAYLLGQLRNQEAHDISGLPNGVVVGVKALMYLVPLTALLLSVRRVGESNPSSTNPTRRMP